MSANDRAEPRLALHRIPNGLIVLLTVALLLQGPVGAYEALRDYTLKLSGALLGGEELFTEVLCQTAPLALAAAAIAFSIRCGWLTWSGTSLIGASLLVLAGTLLGGELRSLFAQNRPALKSQITVMPVSVRGETPVVSSSLRRSSVAEIKSDSHSDSQQISSGEAKTISLPQALAMLSDIRSPATDGSHHHWSERVPRVALLPEPETAVGIVTWAINQLLGYFVVYRLRLFLAAVLLGCYIGWSWQPYFEPIRSWVRNKKSLAKARPLNVTDRY